MSKVTESNSMSLRFNCWLWTQISASFIPAMAFTPCTTLIVAPLWFCKERQTKERELFPKCHGISAVLMKSSLFIAVFWDYCSLRITLEVRGSTVTLYSYHPIASVCTGMNQQDAVSTEWSLKGTKRRWGIRSSGKLCLIWGHTARFFLFYKIYTINDHSHIDIHYKFVFQIRRKQLKFVERNHILITSYSFQSLFCHQSWIKPY